MCVCVWAHVWNEKGSAQMNLSDKLLNCSLMNLYLGNKLIKIEPRSQIEILEIRRFILSVIITKFALKECGFFKSQEAQKHTFTF